MKYTDDLSNHYVNGRNVGVRTASPLQDGANPTDDGYDYIRSINVAGQTPEARTFSPASGHFEDNYTAKTVTVHYDLNGATGSVPEDQTVQSGFAVVLGEPTITERFKRWNATPIGNGIDYFAGHKTYIDDDITLYALWE